MEPIPDPKADLMSSADRTAGQEDNVLENPRKNAARNGKAHFKFYTRILITIWTVIMFISLGWNLYQARQETQAMALATARITFDKDLLYRRWAAIHGGVYVPVSPETPPNPYLQHVLERDLTTPSGRHLTLMNPAYMTRQVYTFSQKESSTRGHITSLKPLRPQNAPDTWEILALKSFEQGKPEASTIETIEGQPYFRLMHPFKTEKNCLKCHAQQGYQEGDIRGGISVSIPLAPLYASQRRTILTISLGHALLWLLGLVGIVLGRRGVMTAWQQQEQAETALQQSNYQLQDRNREISLTSELADQLHACMTIEEAYQIISHMGPRLFPEHSGTVLLLNASRNILETTVTWGENSPEPLVMYPQNCWALRRGRPYLMQDPERDLVCEHLSSPSGSGYFCVPLMAQGETLGVLHLRAKNSAAAGGSPPPFSESCQSLARAVADHLALSLGNLRLQESLRHQAIRDPLTGLFNRRFMLETLERELYRIQRKKSSLCVFMMDLDHFRRFNETFGHAAGDAVLSALGRLLLSQVRKEDVACRYGGEEFTVILPETSLETGRGRAEELRQSVHDLKVEHLGQNLGSITISLGVAVYPQNGVEPEALLRAADEALYKAKHAGRDQVVIADQT